MSISVKDFNKRMQSKSYRDEIFSKIHSKNTKYKYNLNYPILEENKMIEIERKKPKQESDLNKEELMILTKIKNDKYSVGGFAGMIFNKYVELNQDKFKDDGCPIKLVETAVRVRKLIQDMSYQD